MLVTGPTGSGKSSLLGVVTGLVPRFSGGTLAGDVPLDGRSVLDAPPREQAARDRGASDRTRSPASSPTRSWRSWPTAWSGSACRRGDAPPGRGDPRPARRRRAARTTCAACQAGSSRRVAISWCSPCIRGCWYSTGRRRRYEPTAAEDVLATITRLVHDVGVSVLLAEHRLERVVPFAARICLLPGDGSLVVGPPASVLAISPVVPPLVELGRAGGAGSRCRSPCVTRGGWPRRWPCLPPEVETPVPAPPGVVVLRADRGARPDCGGARGGF